MQLSCWKHGHYRPLGTPVPAAAGATKLFFNNLNSMNDILVACSKAGIHPEQWLY
jgi:hypothetical protein